MRNVDEYGEELLEETTDEEITEEEQKLIEECLNEAFEDFDLDSVELTPEEQAQIDKWAKATTLDEQIELYKEENNIK